MEVDDNADGDNIDDEDVVDAFKWDIKAVDVLIDKQVLLLLLLLWLLLIVM